jgi:hypothetical protein
MFSSVTSVTRLGKWSPLCPLMIYSHSSLLAVHSPVHTCLVGSRHQKRHRFCFWHYTLGSRYFQHIQERVGHLI